MKPRANIVENDLKGIIGDTLSAIFNGPPGAYEQSFEKAKRPAARASDSLEQLAKRINDAHVEAIQHARTAVERACEAGRFLIEAKAQVGHGGWLPWLAKHCPKISERTAQAYMRASKGLLEHPELAAETLLEGLLQKLANSKPRSAPPNPQATAVFTPAPPFTGFSSKEEELKAGGAMAANLNKVFGWDTPIPLPPPNPRDVGTGDVGTGDAGTGVVGTGGTGETPTVDTKIIKAAIDLPPDSWRKATESDVAKALIGKLGWARARRVANEIITATELLRP